MGDTVTLRPFADALRATDRKVLVRKPGFTAQYVTWMDDRFGVLWISGAGKVLADVYDINTLVNMHEEAGKIGENDALMFDQAPADEMDDSYFDPFAIAEESDSAVESASLDWNISYSGTVRVRTSANKGAGGSRTILMASSLTI